MTADTVGGVWTYTLELCRALAPHGIEVALATMGDVPTAGQLAQAAALSNLTLHTSSFKLEWMQQPWDDVARAGDWLLDLERQTHPDLIHLNGYAHAALSWNAPVLSLAHSCVLSWWAAVKKTPLPDEWLDYAAHVSQGLRAAAHVVAPSQAMLDSLKTHYRALPSTSVIYNGRSRGIFHSGEKRNYILSAGRLWDEAKNLQALSAVADRLIWPVMVAGPLPPARGPLAVQCLGRLEETQLAQRMSEAAIYALPARYEPFGLSALEAALSGCALVLGDIPSLREIWGDAAAFVNPDDVDHLAVAMQKLIKNPASRHDLVRRARSRARRYTLQKMGSEYLSLYQKLLSAASQPGVKACAS